jgi:hypothetical protein
VVIDAGDKLEGKREDGREPQVGSARRRKRRFSDLRFPTLCDSASAGVERSTFVQSLGERARLQSMPVCTNLLGKLARVLSLERESDSRR